MNKTLSSGVEEAIFEAEFPQGEDGWEPRGAVTAELKILPGFELLRELQEIEIIWQLCCQNVLDPICRGSGDRLGESAFQRFVRRRHFS